MPIHNEQTDHAFHCTGKSMTETEHAERCSIEFQIDRMSRGLNPNWGNPKPPVYGYEKMDNSITDHRIAMKELVTELESTDLSNIPDKDWAQLDPSVQTLLSRQRISQINAAKAKNDEKLKNDETAQKQRKEDASVLAAAITEALTPDETPRRPKKS